MYVDNETGQPIAPHVGKCNRENNCGYHYTPAQFFRENPQLGDGEAWKQSEAWKTVYQPPAPKPPDFLPREVMERTLQHYGQNNFIRYLVQLFGEEKAHQLARAFNLGTSKKWKEEAGGYSVIFWQVDKAGNIRQAKAMAYNPQTGRRLKAEGQSFVSFAGKALAGKDANLQQCFFGEHQLSQRPAAPVALVESEKTAVIMAGIKSDVVWLATGGKHGARWTEESVYSALEGRKVILFPDLGAFDTWKERGKILATVCDVETSDLLERKAAPQDRAEGFDVADYFVKALQNATEAPAPVVEPEQRKETAFKEAWQPEYTYQGDKYAKLGSYAGEACRAVREDGKCIRGRNGNMLVEFADGTPVVLPGRQLRKIRPQEARRGQSGPTTPQQEEQAPAGPELAQDEKRRALWKKKAKYYILKDRMGKAAQAQKNALQWPILKELAV